MAKVKCNRCNWEGFDSNLIMILNHKLVPPTCPRCFSTDISFCEEYKKDPLLLKGVKKLQKHLKKYNYLINKISKEITIKDPISKKNKRFIFEGFKEGGNERGELLLVVRYPYTRIFKIYHIDYLEVEE